MDWDGSEAVRYFNGAAIGALCGLAAWAVIALCWAALSPTKTLVINVGHYNEWWWEAPLAVLVFLVGIWRLTNIWRNP